MVLSLLKSIVFRIMQAPTSDINKPVESYYNKLVNTSSQMASRSYSILKT